jgi:hypothetical protein
MWVILGSEILFILNYVFVRTAGENDSKSDVESICSVGRAVISILRLRTSFPLSVKIMFLSPLSPSCWRQLCVRPHSCPFAPKLCVYRGKRRGGGGTYCGFVAGRAGLAAAASRSQGKGGGGAAAARGTAALAFWRQNMLRVQPPIWTKQG